MSYFNDKRQKALESQFGRFWIQQGRVPDMTTIATMAASIEEELPGWIDADLVTEAVKAHRGHTKALPSLSNIISEARTISEAKAQKRAKPVALIPEHAEDTGDTWADVVSLRLRRRMDPNASFDSAWVVEMAGLAPSKDETYAFARMIQAIPAKDRTEIIGYWCGNTPKNPYGITEDRLRSMIPARTDSQDADFWV